MLKVAINLIWFNPLKTSGAIKYTENLLEGLNKWKDELQLTLYCNNSSYIHFSHYSSNQNFKIINLSKSDIRILNILIIYFLFGFFLRRNNEEYLINPIYYVPLIKSKILKVVTVIHDFNSHFYKSNFPFIKRFHHKLSWIISISTSAKIVFISDSILEQARILFPKKSYKFRRIYVPVSLNSNNSNENISSITSSFDINSNEFIYLITSSPSHKNNELFINAFISFLDKNTSKTKLLITGRVDVEKIKSNLDLDLRLDKVIFTGYINDSTKIALIKSCKYVVMPSLYEGFGMPIIEGMLLNKRILCSGIDVFKEITSNNAVFVRDPSNIKEWEKALKFMDKSSDNAIYPSRLLDMYSSRTIAKEFINLLNIL